MTIEGGCGFCELFLPPILPVLHSNSYVAWGAGYTLLHRSKKYDVEPVSTFSVVLVISMIQEVKK